MNRMVSETPCLSSLGIVKLLVFDHLLKFLNDLENYPAEFEFLASIERMGCEKLIGLCWYSQILLTLKNMAFGKVKILIFWSFFFLCFLTFLENYPPKSEIFGSIKPTCSVNRFC